jgi:hypothetical protein
MHPEKIDWLLSNMISQYASLSACQVSLQEQNVFPAPDFVDFPLFPYPEMERVPIFMCDRYTGANELLFVAKATLERSHLVINDLETLAEAVLIRIVPTTPTRPHRIIIHNNGEDFEMFAVDERLHLAMKAHALTRELIKKHTERLHCSARNRKNRNKSTRPAPSRLREISN